MPTLRFYLDEADNYQLADWSALEDGLSRFGRFIHQDRLLPTALRAIVPDERYEQTIFVMEEPPEMRLITYRGTMFFVPTPWVVYFLTQHGNRVWVDRIGFNLQSLTEVDDVLYFPCLPNVYMDNVSTLKVCPNEESKVILEFRDNQVQLGSTFANAIAAFWASNFNDDITAFASFQPFLSMDGSWSAEDGYRKGFENWEKLSTKNILQLPWTRAFPLNAILYQMMWPCDITEVTQPPVAPNAGFSLTPAQALVRDLQRLVRYDSMEAYLPSEEISDEDPAEEEPDEDWEPY